MIKSQRVFSASTVRQKLRAGPAATGGASAGGAGRSSRSEGGTSTPAPTPVTPAGPSLPTGGGGDCDDGDPAISPAASEVCDNIDNDCDGNIDLYATDPSIWYLDSDEDGYGDPNPTAAGAEPGTDCDDSDNQVDSADIDNDGQTSCDGDCDDSDNQTYIGAAEIEAPTLCMQDSDNDGYGDNQLPAFQGDACPNTYGTSFQDRFGCPDADNDGWSDPDLNWTSKEGADAFPENPSQWSDIDNDGWGDNQSEGATQVDDFPEKPTQWLDTDGDGWGDNLS